MPTNSKDLLKIFLATDLHLGHLENDPIRGDDSFVVFEEILQKAKDQQVDMILLGGDLFDKNKPSRSTLWRTMKLIRAYCMGERNIKFRIRSDQNQNFPNSFGGVNFEDPNYNVSIPIFSIHGKHDDPAGRGGLCATEILSMAGLVNYFGKSESVDDIAVYPILFEKGMTRFAVYGLGWIRDERLNATFQERKVQFFKPSGNLDDWFSLLMLHQNRTSHDRKQHVDESMLENFFDFIFWGHEHECLIKPQQSEMGDFYICQPGAPISTSFCEGESKQKFVGILEIKQKEFRLREIPLKQTRPFVIDSMILRPNEPLGSKGDKGPELDTESVRHVSEFLAQKIEELIERATELPYGKEMLPLVRLRVEHQGDVALPNPHRISAMFVGKIANPNEVLLLKRRRIPLSHQKKRERAREGGEKVEEEVEGEEEEENFTYPDRSAGEPKIGDVIESFIGKEMAGDLCLYTEKDLNSALSEFVDKLDTHSFGRCIRKSLSAAAECVQQRKDIDDVTNQGSVRDIIATWRSEVKSDPKSNGQACPPIPSPNENTQKGNLREKKKQDIEREPVPISEPNLPRKRKAAPNPIPLPKKSRKNVQLRSLDIVSSNLSSQSQHRSPQRTFKGLTTTPARRKRVMGVLPSPQTPSKNPNKAPFATKPSFGDWDSQHSLMDSQIQRSQEWGRRKI